MSYSPKSAERMRRKSEKELLAIIESGSLLHAAARNELHSRGAHVAILEADMKFRNRKTTSLSRSADLKVDLLLLKALIGEV